MREAVLKRIPKQGDRWQDANNETDIIFQSLTEGLEYVYRKTKCIEYHISTFDGVVYNVTPDIKKEEPTKKFSMYDEEDY